MASKRRQRRKSCEGKRRFHSEEIAVSSIGTLSGLVPYRCAFCGGFHVGHPPRRVRQSLAAKRRNAEP